MGADDAKEMDELVLRDLPGKLALIVFAAATVALGWEVWGILFRFGTFLRPLATLDGGDIAGLALFVVGWLGIVAGLLVLRHRRHGSAH